MYVGGTVTYNTTTSHSSPFSFVPTALYSILKNDCVKDAMTLG